MKQLPTRCKRCRTKLIVEKHHPFCSYKCWKTVEDSLTIKERILRDKRHHKRFTENIRERTCMDVDENRGSIILMLKRSKELNAGSYGDRCHSCGCPIRHKRKMIRDGEWLYCDMKCHSQKMDDDTFMGRHSGFRLHANKPELYLSTIV